MTQLFLSCDVVRSVSFLFRFFDYFFEGACSHVANHCSRHFNREASVFYDRLVSGGFDPNAHIDVLPQHRLLYISNPKCASTTIKMVLSSLARNQLDTSDQLHKRRYSGLKSPKRGGISAFHEVATHPAAFRFSFVRNPYSRLVSTWADKFQNKPLVCGDSFIDQYLMNRDWIDETLPKGADSTLSFPQFVQFAAATANRRLDAHWHLQDDLLTMPGIKLDLVGKVESFAEDFASVLDHAGAGVRLRQIADVHFNASQHQPWPNYYTAGLADRAYRAYERDFDRFNYSRTIPA
ncbi:MAG: sulfotransferase family protein [Xanthobacteraceae bacterium]